MIVEAVGLMLFVWLVYLCGWGVEGWWCLGDYVDMSVENSSKEL